MTEPPQSPRASQHRTPGDPSVSETQKDKVQRQLDEALADSFPASDPVSIVTSHEEEDWGAPDSK